MPEAQRLIHTFLEYRFSTRLYSAFTCASSFASLSGAAGVTGAAGAVDDWVLFEAVGVSEGATPNVRSTRRRTKSWNCVSTRRLSLGKRESARR